MGLIDVPKSREEIAAFLADGQTRSAPFVTTADISDGEILGKTITTDLGGGSYKFSITLPSGRPLESAPVGPDYSKRDASYQWVAAVTSAMLGDYEQAADDAARAARLSEPLDIPPDEPVRSSPAPRSSPPSADPVEYARGQLRASLERLSQLVSAEADVERWQKVVNALTGIVPPGTKRKKRRKKTQRKAGL